jgi:hypothetical protein
VADGYGNVEGSVSTNEGGLVGSTKCIQTIRVPYTATPTDQGNYYSNVPVVFPYPFVDTNYSISVSIEIQPQSPWVASTALALGYTIFDSNRNLQQITTAGTTGATLPVWSLGPAYNGATVDGTATWTMFTAGDFFFYNAAKFKTSAGFVADCGSYDFNTPFSFPVILSVVAIHD